MTTGQLADAGRGFGRFLRIGLAGAVLLTATIGLAEEPACNPAQVTLRGAGGVATLDVIVADTARARARGLMFVRQMPADAGMLFVYDAPQPVSFWMRNTLIPLDMIFFDETGEAVRVHEGAQPLDETPIPGGDNIAYVLEINAGRASELGLSEGTVMRHPSVTAPVWPCAAP